MAKIDKFNDREKLSFDIEYFEDIMQTEWDSDPEIESQYKIVDYEFDGHEKCTIGNTGKEISGDHNNAVDVADAPRSTGSILKPLLYCSMMNGGDIAKRGDIEIIKLKAY